MEHIRMYLLIFWSFYLGGCLCTIQISKDKCGFSGDSVTFSCTIAATDFSQPFLWRNDKISGDISVCGPGSCSTPSESRYSASANTTAISLTVTNLIRSDDETNWNCLLQGSGSPTTISLSVRDYPSSCALSKSGDDYMCETGCGYPKSDLTIDWFLSTSSGLKDLTNPMETTSTAGCSTGGKASATFKESDITEDGTLYCRCGMQIACPEKVEIVSNNITITRGKSDVSLGLLITDIILFVIYMPLYWFVVVTTKDKDKIWGMEYSNVAAIIITVIGVISVILCGVGYGISDTQKSTGEALSIVGFVIGVLMLIATIFIVIQAKFTVINKKKCGKEDPKTGNNTISPGNTNATDDQKGQQNDERPEQLEILNQKNSPDKSQRKKSEIIEASEKEKCTDKKGDPV